VAGCAGDDNAGSLDSGQSAARDGSVSERSDPKDAAHDAAKKTDGGAMASFSKTSLVFTAVPCGGMAQTDTLTVTNHGASSLAVSASITGSAFSVNPAVLNVAPGKTGTLTVTATATTSATAGTALVGSLTLFTNDPSQTHLSVPLSAIPVGASLAILPNSTFAFPTGAVNTPATPLLLTLSNQGNEPGTFTFAALPSASPFSFSVGSGGAADGGGGLSVTLGAGDSAIATANFTPTLANVVTATSAITATGTVCAGQASLGFSGQGALGDVTGWPTTVDFGPSYCGGPAPANQTFTLTNSGVVDATMTTVTISPGFTTTAKVGRQILAGGISVTTVTGPSVPANSPTTPITGTLTIQTDADLGAGTPPHTITLTEEPSGAILMFDTTSTPYPPNGFGSFGPVLLLDSATQSFNVKNIGTVTADVTLVASTNGFGGDGGAAMDSGAGADAGGATDGGGTSEAGGAGEAGVNDGGDAGSGGAPVAPFSVAPPSFAVDPGGSQAEVVTFMPLSANGVTGSITMTTVTGSVCGTLPAPLILSGSGLGGGPNVAPSSLTFSPTCGGAAPGPQSFVVSNNGSADLTWAMSALTGPGASQYTLTATPPPGILIPGAMATVTVMAQKIPSPAPNATPSQLAAQVTITTDVPLDPPHVVSLSETPLGDQLSFSTLGPVRFGQVPINTTLPQGITISNNANLGSPGANVSFALVGTGAAGYVAPAAASNVAPGKSAAGTLTFAPTSSGPYPATLGIVTSDPLCTPLPTPLTLSGTGTQGAVSLSATSFAFGTDANDPAGMVNCGVTGLTHTLTISNVGNQAFNVTGLTLGLGAASPYKLSGPGTTLPATVAIGGSVTITIAPTMIPPTVANPSDATPFTDTLTVTTNAAQDTAHVIPLVMQARGAVIANTPLATAWSFGTASFGSIGTFTSTIQNTGNSGVSIALKGVQQPTIFDLQTSPTLVAGNTIGSIVGQFIPPSSDGSWTDSGILAVTATQAFCEPLPAAWNLPTINLSGASNSSAAVSVSGSLVFPNTDCGSAAPAGQALLLGNATDVPYAYKATFSSGKYYTIVGAANTIPANGTAAIVVTPTNVLPGPGVMPGSAPYADDLLITVDTAPPSLFTVPISWALNGAVLSLPFGAGPRVDGMGNSYYPADSTTGYLLSIGNTGTSPASVDFAIAPPGAFTLSPAPPTEIIPGIGATPELISSSSDQACPSTTVATATFVYSGPVCQPLPVSSVTVEACFGAF
jgi:hypothetical protein